VAVRGDEEAELVGIGGRVVFELAETCIASISVVSVRQSLAAYGKSCTCRQRPDLCEASSITTRRPSLRRQTE